MDKRNIAKQDTTAAARTDTPASGAETRRITEARVRILVLAGFFILLFGLVIARLWYLQVDQYETYTQKVLNQQLRDTTITANRGTIYDTNMNILACAQSVENVYLAPNELKQAGEDIQAISAALAQILDKDAALIARKAADRSMRYQQIAANVDTETAAAIRQYINENQVSGIHLEPSAKRYYPYGSLAAQVIGFTNASGTGSEGIEAAYNSFLEGTAGKVITSKGNNDMDMPFSREDFIASTPGCDVVLTLDATVQQCLEKRMEEAIAKYAVQNGAFGLVMNAKTGEILAMATLGSYDPNNYLEITSQSVAEDLEKIRPYEPQLVKAAWNVFGESYLYRKKYNEYRARRQLEEKGKNK